MAGNREAVDKRKRKASKAEHSVKTQLKRRRAPPAKPNEKMNEYVRRLLTGAEPDDGKSEDREDGECEEESVESEEKDADDKTEGEADSAPKAAWTQALSEAHAKRVNVTVLLENANLETVKQSGRSGGVALLNCEDHRHVLRKTGREANDARPDITHQCLLALMDSPLNKAGRLKVYIRTAKNVLIEVQAQTRIPRTIRRFSGLMAELLEKFKVRGTSGATPLLKVIRNPITSHLAVGTRKVVCTYNTENVVDMREHAAKMGGLAGSGGEEEGDGGDVVDVLYVVGAMAHGKVSEEWADEYICVSEYPLSAATVCSRITYAYECLLGIL